MTHRHPPLLGATLALAGALALSLCAPLSALAEGEQPPENPVAPATSEIASDPADRLADETAGTEGEVADGTATTGGTEGEVADGTATTGGTEGESSDDSTTAPPIVWDGNVGVHSNEPQDADDEPSDEGVVPDDADKRANSWRYLDGTRIVMPDTDNPVQPGGIMLMYNYKKGLLNFTVTKSGGTYRGSWKGGSITVTNAKAFGVDVSEHNGTIDWAKAKRAGVDFAIIRCGWGNDGSKSDDKLFLQNVKGAKAQGIKIGVYIYSYAGWQDQSSMTLDKWYSYASGEADHTLAMLKKAGLTPGTLDYPVYYDLEESYLENSTLTYHGTKISNRTFLANIAKRYCEKIQAAGYKAGIYANLNWWDHYLTDSCFKNWEHWVARYPMEGNATGSNYGGTTGMWQAHSEAFVDGIGTCDINFDYLSRGRVDATGTVNYATHVASKGWLASTSDGRIGGTTGQAKAVEAFALRLKEGTKGSIVYNAKFKNGSWQGERRDGAVAGTTGQAKPLEAISIRLDGDVAKNKSVWYRAHMASYGWLGWAKDGALAGTNCCDKQLEAFEVQILDKDKTPAGYSASVSPSRAAYVHYVTHVQNIGWQGDAFDGTQAGTTGRALRLEGLKMHLTNVSGGITYQTHVQNIGWQGAVANNALSGTTGRALRLEAVKISLTGAAAQNYDVQYRTHIQNVGWTGWASNGAPCGSEGRALRMEALEVRLVSKGTALPKTSAKAFYR